MACRVNRSIHSGGIWPVGSGSAPLWMGVMWYTFFVSHPVKASKNSTRSWMNRPSMSWRNPSPAVGSFSICEESVFSVSSSSERAPWSVTETVMSRGGGRLVSVGSLDARAR